MENEEAEEIREQQRQATKRIFCFFCGPMCLQLSRRCDNSSIMERRVSHTIDEKKEKNDDARKRKKITAEQETCRHGEVFVEVFVPGTSRPVQTHFGKKIGT